MIASSTSDRRRDPAIFAGILVACLLLVGVLWLFARNADSSGISGDTVDLDVPPYTAAEVCNNWAQYWTVDSNIGAPPAALEMLSNCRETTAGNWIVAQNANNPDLVRPLALTGEQRAAVEPIESAIQAGISAFVPSESQELQDVIKNIYNPAITGVVTHLIDGRGVGTARKLYRDELTAFLDANPQYAALQNYVSWAMEQRQNAWQQVVAVCQADDVRYLRLTCEGLGDTMSVNYPPWTWDLGDPLLMDAYLQAVVNGSTPVPPGFDAPVGTEPATT